MKRTWIAIDVSCLAYRVWYSLPKLTWKGQPTEVLFGFFRAVEELRTIFASDDLVFCFDSKSSKRREIFPGYKLGRHEHEDKEHRLRRKAFKAQMKLLKTRCLPRAGFRNVFVAQGYESDDLLAVVAMTVASQGQDEVVIVTRDSDLYQCLRPRVVIYDPQLKKVRDHLWFRKQYGIPPRDWVKVKAMAGCKTDSIPGIRGVGEKTALSFLQYKCRSDKVARDILSSGDQFSFNLKLVKLPFPGCPVPDLQEQTWNRSLWSRMLKGLGIHEL